MWEIRYRSRRKHKNDILSSSKHIDQMSTILNRNASSALKKLSKNNSVSISRAPSIHNNHSVEQIYSKEHDLTLQNNLTNRLRAEKQLTDRKSVGEGLGRVHSSLEPTAIKRTNKISSVHDYTALDIPKKAQIPSSGSAGNDVYKNFRKAIRRPIQRHNFNLDSALNNSITGRHIQVLGANDYSPFVNKDKKGEKYSLNNSNAGSQRELINNSSDLPLKLKKNRDFFNPITGGIL